MMITTAELNYCIVVCVQLLLLLFHASYLGVLKHVPKALCRGALIGVFVGLTFDVVAGKMLGVHSYILGWSMSFLVLNAMLSYGLFAAHILIMQHLLKVGFFAGILLITAVYECINLFAPVWQWQFVLPLPVVCIVLVSGYVGGALVVVVLAARFFRVPFRIFS